MISPSPTTSELARRLLQRVEWFGDCLVWRGSKNAQGYGKVKHPDERYPGYVHRYAHELWVGPIPDGLTVDHVRARGCRSRACILPAHLEAVTMQEQHDRRPRPVKCPQGHEFTKENTYVNPSGHRACRACHRDTERARRAARADED